jgi:hypothetical protein
MTDDTRSDKELADAEVEAYLAIDDTREQLHALLDGWRIPRVVSGDPRDTFSLYERAWLLSERYRKVAPEEFDHARLERAMAAANLARITAARKAVAAASPPPDVAAQAVKAALVPHSEGDHRWGAACVRCQAEESLLALLARAEWPTLTGQERWAFRRLRREYMAGRREVSTFSDMKAMLDAYDRLTGEKGT